MSLFAFGKHPARSDFVCHGLDDALWLVRILDELAVHGHPGHEQPWFDLSGLPRVAWLRQRRLLRRPDEARLWMCPSADRHGRRFPLIVGWLWPAASSGSTNALDQCQPEKMKLLLESWGIADMAGTVPLALLRAEQESPASFAETRLSRWVVARFWNGEEASSQSP